jgi:hypothetical protein
VEDNEERLQQLLPEVMLETNTNQVSLVEEVNLLASSFSKLDRMKNSKIECEEEFVEERRKFAVEY